MWRETGFTRKQGESVWAPTMAMGLPGFHAAPMANAMIVLVLRVR